MPRTDMEDGEAENKRIIHGLWMLYSIADGYNEQFEKASMSTSPINDR